MWKCIDLSFPWSAVATSLPLHLLCFVFTPSIPTFLLVDTLLTWSSLSLGGKLKWPVSVGECVRVCVFVCVRRYVQYKPLSVFLTKLHCGGPAVRKGYSDYYTVQVLVLHTTKTVCSIDSRTCFPMIYFGFFLYRVQQNLIIIAVHKVIIESFCIVGKMVQQMEKAQLALWQGKWTFWEIFKLYICSQVHPDLWRDVVFCNFRKMLSLPLVGQDKYYNCRTKYNYDLGVRLVSPRFGQLVTVVKITLCVMCK